MSPSQTNRRSINNGEVRRLAFSGSVLSLIWLAATTSLADEPYEIRSWLAASQRWQRDSDGPIIGLGDSGSFDDTHIFAPTVARDRLGYRLWYCGSTGEVGERLFQLGLAQSADGIKFRKHEDNPVFQFGDGRHSVLTPTVMRDDGRWRMWFSSTWFEGGTGRHTLHESFSEDGVRWSKPSEPLLEGVYAPSVIKTGRHFQMWYVDVTSNTWDVRHASSLDGRQWRVTPEVCLTIDQPWEQRRLFYPTVAKVGDAYLMWYGSYWVERSSTTALGFAASVDGLKWYKHAQNPVLTPDPQRPRESNYVTSQSIARNDDGSFRIWYASRKKPPFVNKYFAINTAKWLPDSESIQGEESIRSTLLSADQTRFRTWQKSNRSRLSRMLGIPQRRVSLDAERRGELQWDGIVIEKWVFTSEAGSRVPAVLYRPMESPQQKMPAIVLTYGHGGSKSQWQYNYAGQLYARLGVACLAIDPLGEEERHVKGQLGTRAHDPKLVSDRADEANRLIMGKLVFDAMRGIDFLTSRDDIDPQRIGVAGNSLGGATAGWLAALEPRICTAIVSGWAYHNIGLRTKYCTKLPNQRMREWLTWSEYAALAAPDCAVMIANGDADWVIDRDDDQTSWRGLTKIIEDASEVYRQQGAAKSLKLWFEADGGHRPYFVYKDALIWIHEHLGTPNMTLEEIRALPTINSGRWCDANDIRLERLYGTELHQRGATLPDLKLRPTPRALLACLTSEELGSPQFTVEGWLKVIAEKTE